MDTNIQTLIAEFVRTHPLAAVATSSSLNMPSVSSLYVFCKPEFTFYFGTRTSTQKFLDIEENPYVALACTDAETLEILQMRGKVEVVLNPAAVRSLTEELRAMYESERKKWMAPADKAARGIYHIDVSRWVPPVSQIHDGAYVFMKLTPEWARLRKYDADWKEGKDFTEHLYTA